MISTKLMLMTMILLSQPVQASYGNQTLAAPPSIPMPKDALPGNSMPMINRTPAVAKMNRKQRRAKR